MVSTTQNYYKIWGEAQKTVHRLFNVKDGHIHIRDGVLTTSDFEITSLRQGENILGSTRSELQNCIEKLRDIEDVRKFLETKDLSNEHASLLKQRMEYITHLKETMTIAVQFMDINQILRNEAYDAILALINAASGDKLAHPIEITITL